MSAPDIRRLESLGDTEIRELGDVLIDCVEGGASVNFMWPMTRAKADAFWTGTAASVDRGERTVFAAYDPQGRIVGTVQVIWAPQENQPHRGEIAKMLVHRRARKGGLGAALLTAAEQHAREAGKTLLVLDTASADAERLYVRQGWHRCGVIPDFALLPDGDFCDTVVFYKPLPAR